MPGLLIPFLQEGFEAAPVSGRPYITPHGMLKDFRGQHPSLSVLKLTVRLNVIPIKTPEGFYSLTSWF